MQRNSKLKTVLFGKLVIESYCSLAHRFFECHLSSSNNETEAKASFYPVLFIFVYVWKAL